MQKEINKLLKRVNAEKLKHNHKECIEIYNIIGGMYTEIGSYEEAIHYHKEALHYGKLIGDRLNCAVTLRYIGEARASLGDFNKAADYIKKYLELAEKTDNEVEIQRAWTTLGRIYLMQAQDLKDKSNVIDDRIKSIAVDAERRFEKALELAKSVKDSVDPKEYAQMRSGLLVNIALVKDICGQFDDTVSKFDQAIFLCRSAKLKEDLYRCQIILAGIFRSKSGQKKYIERASTASLEALTIAKQIGKKIMICEALIEVGLVKIWQYDFKGAKHTFALAYLEKSPSEEDHAKAIRLTKLSHLIYETYEKLQSHKNLSSEMRIKMRDKLGDLFVAIDAFKLASESYKKALEEAKKSHAPKTEQARILYSMAETYADNYQFEHALLCYEKELAYRQGNNSEQCKTLIKIAHMHEYLNHDLETVSASYDEAMKKAENEPKLMYLVLKDYVPYLEKHDANSRRTSELEEKLLNIKSYEEVMQEIKREEELVDVAEDFEDEIADVDDIITDDEDNDEVLMLGRRRARGGTKKFKPNEVGDTPLHEACIKGDFKRVVSLIEQGHDINPCDNAGWIPLHEACNHGHGEIVDFLLENGADVNNRGLKGTTPLHDAATNGHYDIMRSLIRYGANVIALTDTGETVLSCLRDYKKRNYPTMSNNEMSEYRTMESELMNLMDQTGFNLIEESKEKGANSVKPPTSASKACASNPYMAPSSSRSTAQDPVTDYRQVIKGLKRRDTREGRKDLLRENNLPATVDTTLSTSAPTKEWLIDDVSRQQQTLTRRSRRMQELMMLESESDDDDDDVELVIEKTRASVNDAEGVIGTISGTRNDLKDRKAINHDDDDEIIISHQSENPVGEDVILEEDGAEEEEVIEPMSQFELRSPTRSMLGDQLSNFSNSKAFDDIVRVTIGDKNLVISIKNQSTSVKELKETIAARYAVIAKAKPVITLSLTSDENCLLFDDDLCQNVISGPILARVDSWILDPMAETYTKACQEFGLEPLGAVKHELVTVEKLSNKLDISNIRIPNSHVKPFISALSHRDFTCADMSGASVLFSYGQNAQMSLGAVFSWQKLVRLELKCTGIGKEEFVSICEGKFGRLPMLESLNLSYNLIVFKDKNEFKRQIELLVNNVTPQVKLINVTKNLLEFVKSMDRSAIGAEMNLAKVLEIGSHNRAAARSGEKGLEIMGAFEQNDMVLY